MKSFTFRLTLRFALLVTATTAAVLIAGGLLLDHQIEHSVELLHDVEARELGGLLGSEATLSVEEVERRIMHDADSDAALFLIQVERRGGEVVFRSENLGETVLAGGAAGEAHWTARLPFLGRTRLSAYEVGPWRILLGSPLQPAERVLAEYGRVSLMLTALVAGLSVVLGYAFSRDTLRPIRAIEATARRIRADNLGERIAVPAGSDELASLTRLLNETFDRLQASFEQMRSFAADASHELKTPLALMRLNAEKIRGRLGSDAEAAAALGDILEEIGRLNQVIETLLFIAKSESGALKLAMRPVDLGTLLQDFAEDARALAEDRGVRFRLEHAARGELAVVPDLFRQLLLNLVANAVAVSPPDGTVTLQAREVDGSWCFEVMDEGPGLPAAEHARIFERFFRYHPGAAAGGVADAAGGGHGLGLAICRAIADLHGGSVWAENRTDRSGLRVIVRLPVRRGDA